MQLETSQQLWRALCQQVEQRLLSGLSLTFPEIGEWKLEEHREYVARTADGKQWLIPPRLTLGLRPVEDRGVTSLSIDLLRDALSEATHVSAEQVATWLRAIPTLWHLGWDIPRNATLYPLWRMHEYLSCIPSRFRSWIWFCISRSNGCCIDSIIQRLRCSRRSSICFYIMRCMYRKLSSSYSIA